MRQGARSLGRFAAAGGHGLAGVIVLPPLAWLLVAAAREAAPGPPDAVALGLLARSMGLAGAATLLALGLGVPYGWWVSRARIPCARGFARAALLPLVLPPYAASFAGILFLGREGWLNSTLLALHWIGQPLEPFRAFGVAAWVLGGAYWPVIALFIRAAARSVPHGLEEAARLNLADAPAARWAAAPAVVRGAAIGALLVFLICLADFGVANSLGLPTYPVDLVNRFQLDREAGPVVRLSLPLLLVVIPLVLLQLRLLNRGEVGPAEMREPRRFGSRLGGWCAALWCALVLAATAGLPLGILVAYALPVSTFGAVWAESWGHLLNTLLSAGGGALLATTVAVIHGWLTRGRTPWPLDLAFTLPYALPASLVGVAMIAILNRPGPLGELYVSLGGLIWTYAALFYPFVYKAMQPGWGRVDPELLDEGCVLGAGRWALFRTAAWPVVQPYAALGVALVGLLAAREMDATALLRIPGGDTVAFRIHDYLHFAPTPKVAALSLLVAALSAAILGAASRILPR